MIEGNNLSHSANATMCLDMQIRNISRIGKSTEESLRTLGIEKLSDLLFYYPRKYLDRKRVKKIKDLEHDEIVTIIAKVKHKDEIVTSGRKKLLKIYAEDDTGEIILLWFNQKFPAKQLLQGVEAAFYGRAELSRGEMQIIHPAYDVIEDMKDSNGKNVHTMRIVPVHSVNSNINQAFLRRVLKNTLEQYGDITDFIPSELLCRRNLISRKAAIYNIHFPASSEMLKKAIERISYEEIFTMQAGLAMRKALISRNVKGLKMNDSDMVKLFIEGLPFKLTGAQSKAIEEIVSDMASEKPMNRLLQGDVGSGKTVVSIAAALCAVGSGFQAAILSPTEILAEQHFATIKSLIRENTIKLSLLTGSLSSNKRKEVVDNIGRGETDIVVGTHALIQEDVDFERLGLAVIDEQHRFGVNQRSAMRSKSSVSDCICDTLIMTATPIPRTVAMTFYGDLDVTVIDEIPPNRKRTDTYVMHPSRRRDAVDIVSEEIKSGRQAYIVCPLIDSSDKLEAKAASDMFEQHKNLFPPGKTALLHGKIRREERERVMESFRKGEISVLFSTTVIEVGVDNQNATVMLIENAERFGLAQLHQLRGRIGRGSYPSKCLLISECKTEDSKKRLDAMAQTSDGFDLAELDMEIRGEGDALGDRQSGFGSFRFLSLRRDIETIKNAREDAFEVVFKDNELSQPENSLIKTEIQRRFADRIDWLFNP